VVGQGWHPKAGAPHAEVYALADPRSDAQGLGFPRNVVKRFLFLPLVSLALLNPCLSSAGGRAGLASKAGVPHMEVYSLADARSDAEASLFSLFHLGLKC
jgi:hypothetical protein